MQTNAVLQSMPESDWEKKMCTMFRRKFNRDFLENFFMITTEGCKQGTFSVYDDETKLVVIG